MIRISPSQLKTYRLCPRKWGWEKLEGVKHPGSSATDLGTEVHEHLEKWLKDGVEIPNTPSGRLAMMLVPDLPPPGEGIVEGKFELQRDGFAYHGYIDLQYVRNDSVLVVRDHKTTSDLKWALDEETLKEDEQALLYAAAAFDEDPDLEEVELEWGYVTTRGKRQTKHVRLRVFRHEIENKIKELDEIAREMVDAHERKLKAEDLPANVTACDAYGGCFYRDHYCKISPTERMKSIMVNGSLKERLAARKAAKEKEKEEKLSSNGVEETKAAASSSQPSRADKGVNAPESKSSASAAPATSRADKGVNAPESKSSASSNGGGMTLRDQFAMAALNGLLANSVVGAAANGVLGDRDFQGVAKRAYELADAMMSAR